MSHKTTVRVVHETEVRRKRIVDYILASTGPGDKVELVENGDPVLLADDPHSLDVDELEDRVDRVLDGDVSRDCFHHGEHGRGNATHVVEIDGKERPVCQDIAENYERHGYDVRPIERALIEP